MSRPAARLTTRVQPSATQAATRSSMSFVRATIDQPLRSLRGARRDDGAAALAREARRERIAEDRVGARRLGGAVLGHPARRVRDVRDERFCRPRATI